MIILQLAAALLVIADPTGSTTAASPSPSVAQGASSGSVSPEAPVAPSTAVPPPAAPAEIAAPAAAPSAPAPAAPAEPEDLSLPSPPEPIPGADFRLESMAHQRVAFKVRHPFRTTVGISHDLQGAGRVLDDGTVQVMVRVPIDSLDTGNAAQNENTAAVLQPEAYPSVVIRALVKPAIPVPAGWSNPQDALEVATDSTASLQVTLHGVTKTMEQVPIHLVYEPHGKVRVSGSFPIDLTAFNVPLPRFFFVRIEKTVDLQFDLLWEPQLASN